MTVDVVEVLEPVEIQHHQDQRLAGRIVDQCRHPFIERAAVSKSRERVGLGTVGDGSQRIRVAKRDRSLTGE